jgi:hypothetical protein
MNTENPKTLVELVAEFREQMSTATILDKKSDIARIEAGKLMLECRKRVEAGEAGDQYRTDFWAWFAVKAKGRSRKDAERVMRLASAPDPMAALGEERRKARESMAEMRKRRGANNADVSSEEIEREARVKAYIEERNREEIKRNNNTYNRQVADLFNWLTDGKEIVPAATNAIEKFAPEAKPMAKRRIKDTISRLETLFAALSGRPVIEVEGEQQHEHANGANGKAAA